MSRFMDCDLDEKRITEEIADMDECKSLINDVCTDPRSDQCCDFPADEYCKKLCPFYTKEDGIITG